MKGLTEEEITEPNESSDESNENVHHIKEVNMIEETNKHYIATIVIDWSEKRIHNLHRIFNNNIAIMPMDKRIAKGTEIHKVTNRYQDVNKKKVKIRRIIPVDVVYDTKKNKKWNNNTRKNGYHTLAGFGLDENFKLTIGKIQMAKNNQP